MLWIQSLWFEKKFSFVLRFFQFPRKASVILEEDRERLIRGKIILRQEEILFIHLS